MDMVNKFSVAGDLWVNVVKQAQEDLVLKDTHNAIQAARYFFLEPAEGDYSDIRKFAGLCSAVGINSDEAAKAIFAGLKPDQQENILGLLKEVCFQGIRPEVIM